MATRPSPQRRKSLKRSPFLYIFLLLLALGSTLGLDFIAGKKGDASLFFSNSAGERILDEEKESPAWIARRILSSLGISPAALNQFQDENGREHLKIDVDPAVYQSLETQLEKALTSAAFKIEKREDQKQENMRYHLWELRSSNDSRLSLLFSCREAEPAAVVNRPPVKPLHKVAIIIDDMGYSREALDAIRAMDTPMTIAVLPFSPLAEETAELANENSLEVILHLPLEPIQQNGADSGGSGFINSRMTADAVKATLLADLEHVPHIKGVNNHMGSRITTNEPIMRIILESLKDKGLYFVDSRTTGDSIAYRMAQELRIPSAFRHVFLDNDLNEEAIKKQLIRLFRQAQKNGFALAIGHPYEATLKVLKNNLALMRKYNCQAVFVSQIVQSP